MKAGLTEDEDPRIHRLHYVAYPKLQSPTSQIFLPGIFHVTKYGSCVLTCHQPLLFHPFGPLCVS